LFLKWDLNVSIDDEMQRIIGWAHADLIFLTQGGPVNIFVDCTFRIVPKGFHQCMVIMIYADAYKSYVPIFYILLQNRKETTYFHALQMVISATNWQLRGKTMTGDFEMALMNAIKSQFRDGPYVGCLFHWKQAIRRKLVERNIPKDYISILMNELNILTVLPIEDIIPKGIPYVRSKTIEVGNEVALNAFWVYFVQTWMKKYNPNMWNIYGVIAGDGVDEIMINRTNNPLERYNRTMNEAMPPHPSMQLFVKTINLESLSFVERLDNIKKKRFRPTPSDEVNIHEIPEDYYAYVEEMNLIL